MRNSFLVLFVAVIVLMGCCNLTLPASNETQNTLPSYTCPDGAVVTYSSECQPKMVQCPDGSKATSLSKCPPMELTKPGRYICNEWSNYAPCDTYLQVYCDKFSPTDLTVREAASAAISNNPGAFSINQLLDIYDWVHTNVFYQNVPVNFTYQPYYPNETIKIGSGDCKNQAVVIASMVEAIGGTARVLIIPDCQHAFSEVYAGNISNKDIIENAVWAHYPRASGKDITWDSYSGERNGTEAWFIFDTAGGEFPGQTIEDCYNASQVFFIYDCANLSKHAPASQGTAYGPKVIIDDTDIIRAGGWWLYHSVNPADKIPSQYKWCHYDVDVESLSGPMDWYVTDQTGYNNYKSGASFRYYYGEEQVQGGTYQLDWTLPSKFYILTMNNGRNSITVKTHVNETCYKG